MKIEKENDKIYIYIVKEYLDYYQIDLKNNASLELKKLFKKINKIYNLNLLGFYEVIVRMNDNYGIIIEMEKDDDRYIKLFKNQLDMKITFKFDEKIYYSSDIGDYIYEDKIYSHIPNYEGDIIFGNEISKFIKI